jgi:hypothetical protein
MGRDWSRLISRRESGTPHRAEGIWETIVGTLRFFLDGSFLDQRSSKKRDERKVLDADLFGVLPPGGEQQDCYGALVKESDIKQRL